MRIRAANVLALLLVLAAGALHSRAAADAADPFDVLKRFVGRWETTAHIHHVGPPARDITTRGRAVCEPTLGGRWFEFRTETVPAGNSDLQIMTYDPEARIYRQWVFSSDGYRHEAVGTWNAATNILQWKGGTPDGSSFVIDDHWVSPDRLEWTLRRTDAESRVIQTIEGTVER